MNTLERNSIVSSCIQFGLCRSGSFPNKPCLYAATIPCFGSAEVRVHLLANPLNLHASQVATVCNLNETQYVIIKYDLQSLCATLVALTGTHSSAHARTKRSDSRNISSSTNFPNSVALQSPSMHFCSARPAQTHSVSQWWVCCACVCVCVGFVCFVPAVGVCDNIRRAF